MNNSIDLQVNSKIKKAKKGSIFFVETFADMNNARAVNKALERAVTSSKLHRVTTGMYVRAVVDRNVGIVLPSIEDIAEAIAQRDKARIVPTGSYAMYRLGLTTQVPLNVVYYTDSASRKVKIGKQVITFKRASTKNVAYIGEISKLVILALKTIGESNVTDEEIKKMRILLKKEKLSNLQHDLKFASEWIRKKLNSNSKEESND